MTDNNHHTFLLEQALGELLNGGRAALFGEGDGTGLGQMTGEFVAVLLGKCGGNGNILADIARGLAHATQKLPGFIHRDLKPKNYFIGHAVYLQSLYEKAGKTL